ncbi:hypothetical protein CVT26_004426 [Gymnopilus dilepis]|uniref:Uncharacterized protein n=1 Tax=Gymnopilus dilepis TaxID=231916 RepID=A0A409WDX4_9AGAR|nr:hypothetical protein CVT26_004426 [Gymnopilus dilepis]
MPPKPKPKPKPRAKKGEQREPSPDLEIVEAPAPTKSRFVSKASAKVSPVVARASASSGPAGRARASVAARGLSVTMIKSSHKIKPGHVNDEAEEVEDNSSEIDPDVNEADVEEDVGFEDVEGSVIDVSDSEGSLVDFIVSDNEVEDEGLDNSSGEDLEALAPDDSEYPEPQVPIRVAGAKRPAPTTPPLSTRTTASKKARVGVRVDHRDSDVDLFGPVGSSRQVDLATPSRRKKAEKAATATASPTTEKVPKKTVEAATKRKFNLAGMKPRAGNPLPPVEESVADHGSETLSTSIPDPSETGPAPEKVPEVDAQDVDANDEAGAVVSLPLPVDPSPEVPITPKQKKIFNLSSLTKKDPNAVHLQDSRGCLRSGPSPDKCQVANPAQQSQIMKANGLYDDLPNLKAVNYAVTSSSGSKGYGLPTIDRVYERTRFQDFDIERALNAIIFVEDGRFVNLSRIAPSKLYARPSSWSQDGRYEICVSPTDTAICVSLVMVTKSNIRRPTESKYPACELQGRMFAEEFDRFVAVLGMVIGQDELTIAMYKDAMTFGTKGAKAVADSQSSGLTHTEPADDIAEYLDPSTSPTKRAGPETGRVLTYKEVPVKGNVPPLDSHDPIPAYDCRSMKDISFTKETFENVSKLPLYNGEIPADSLVMVGYVTYLQKRGVNFKIFTYARWILVLEAIDPPKDTIEEALAAS